MPITYVSAAVNTVRPPDEVIIESTEISGMAVFEEVLNPDDVTALRDPLREKLMDLAKQHGGRRCRRRHRAGHSALLETVSKPMWDGSPEPSGRLSRPTKF